ncbi:putative Glutamine amidotransferase domain-containing protein [Seiridium cardinale]
MSAIRIAILIHTDDPIPLQMMRDSYRSIFDRVAPGSHIEFFNLLLSPELPSLSNDEHYDLIILGGGTYIPDPKTAWVQQLVKFERELLSKHTKQKIMAICLGHQALATVSGSKLDFLPEPEARLTPLR